MRKKLLSVLLTALPALAAHAANWEQVATDKGARVELDRHSLLNSDSGAKIAWMRMLLSPDDAKAQGYVMVKALSRYDCRANQYTTVKRVYLREDMTVAREERVEGEAPSAIKPGSADERLFREICPAPTPSNLRQVAMQAADAGKAVEASEKRPAAKAEAHSEPAPKAEAKAEAKTEAKPAAKPEAAAPAEAKKPLVDIRPNIRKDELRAEAAASKEQITRAAAEKPAKPEAHADAKPAAKPEPEKHAAAEKPAEPKAAAKPAHGEPAPAARPRLEDGSLGVALNEAVRRAREREMKINAAPAPRRAAAPMQLAMAAPADAHGHSHAPASPVRELAKSPAPVESKDSHGNTHEIHWSYEGETGPDNWGKLKPEWKACTAGERQSPIDIRGGILVDQEPIKFDYKPTGARIVDNGHTVQVNLGAGNWISVMGREYQLVQFHFHRPSEERVNGRLYDMVAHLVHKDRDGNLAVVAVLLDHGADNAFIQNLWNNMPLDKGMDNAIPGALDMGALLPKDRGYFAYMGSLTTPPCSEGVLWLVLKSPTNVGDQQVEVFSRLYRNNARPIQQAKARTIRESK